MSFKLAWSSSDNVLGFALPPSYADPSGYIQHKATSLPPPSSLLLCPHSSSLQFCFNYNWVPTFHPVPYPGPYIGTTRSGKEMPTPRSSLNGMAGLKTTHTPHPRWMTPKCGLAVQSYFPHCLSRNQSMKMRTYCAGIIHIYSRPCHLVLGAICSK